MEIIKYIGDLYEPPSEELSVSDTYLYEHWDEVVIPGRTMRFFEWVDNGMERRI